jgi:hypothetical protein
LPTHGQVGKPRIRAATSGRNLAVFPTCQPQAQRWRRCFREQAGELNPQRQYGSEKCRPPDCNEPFRVIDLHCHMLPGIDDGAPDVATSLEMARIALSDGIRVTACTPHIYPGLYENTADGISWPSMHYAANSRRPMSGCN